MPCKNADSGSSPGWPNAQCERSSPSIPSGISTFKSESSVGMISGVLRQASLSVLGAMRLGQRMRKGTRAASS